LSDEEWLEKEELEKREKDPLSKAFGGLVLIVLGVSLLLAVEGIIPMDKWWALFVAGLGIVFLIDSALRYFIPEYKRPITGRVFAGLLLLAIGVSFLLGITEWWPVILIIIGVWLIIRAVS